MSCQKLSGITVVLSGPISRTSFSEFFHCDSCPLLQTSSLWNLQGCITVYLSRYILLTLSESATAYLKYHIFICLSTTFFETLKFLFQFLSCIGFPQQRNWVYHPFYWMSTLNFDFFLIFWTIYFKSRKRPIYRHFRLFSALLF